jgi:hypothetical protein
MIRNVIRGSLTLALLTLFGAARPVAADEPLLFHLSGNGVFDPANIGTPKGGTAGIVIGDGSGLAPYTGSGQDFVLGCVDLGAHGLGVNTHVGAVQSYTQGTLAAGLVTWPAEVARNPMPPKTGDKRVHVTHTLIGDIHFKYSGHFVLNPATGAIGAQPTFVVVGGTGLFEGASGDIHVVVVVTGPNPAGGVAFHYEFDGFITLDE